MNSPLESKVDRTILFNVTRESRKKPINQSTRPQTQGPVMPPTISPYVFPRGRQHNLSLDKGGNLLKNSVCARRQSLDSIPCLLDLLLDCSFSAFISSAMLSIRYHGISFCFGPVSWYAFFTYWSSRRAILGFDLSVHFSQRPVSVYKAIPSLGGAPVRMEVRFRHGIE